MKKLIPITTLTALIAFGPSLLAQTGSQDSMRNSDYQNQRNQAGQSSGAMQSTQSGDQWSQSDRSKTKDESHWKSSNQKDQRDHMGRSQSDQQRLRVTQASELMGYDLFDSQGRKAGDISDFAVRLNDGAITHLVVSSGSWFDLGVTGEDRLVPIDAVNRQGDRFTLDITKQQFLETPKFEGDLADISEDVQQQLQTTYASSRAQIENMGRNMAQNMDRPNSANQSRQAGDRQSTGTDQQRDGMASTRDMTNRNQASSQNMDHDRMMDRDRMHRTDRSGNRTMDATNDMTNANGSGISMTKDDDQNNQSRSWQQNEGSFSDDNLVLFTEINDSEVRSQSDDEQIAEVTDALINLEEGRIVYLLVDEDQIFRRDYPNDVVAVPMQAYSSRDGDALVFNFSREQMRSAEQVEDVPSVKAKGGVYSDAYVIRNIN